jgi:hypothetical protein
MGGEWCGVVVVGRAGASDEVGRSSEKEKRWPTTVMVWCRGIYSTIFVFF